MRRPAKRLYLLAIMDSEAHAAAPPVPSESADDLLVALNRLCAAGKVEIRIEAKRLNHIDSPVTVEADGNIWVYAMVGLAFLIWWRVGMMPAAAVLAVGLIVYLTVGRAYVHRRIERRVREKALTSIEIWRKLWRFSGLTLAAPNNPALPACTSPDGNWMAFVRALT